MKYYMESVEQIISAEEASGYIEYGKIEKNDDYNSALSKYYKKLSDVAAALGKTHAYIRISITDSVGCSMKFDVLGEYKNTDDNGGQE